MTQTVMTVLKSDYNSDLVGTKYVVDVTNVSMENLRNIFGDIKTAILVARVQYPSNLRSGIVLIGNTEFNITNAIRLQDATSWYLTEYREHG